MDKQLILLAGLQKTAAHSIQRNCALHTARLREAGFVYPVLELPDGRAESSHTTVLNMLFRAEPGRLGLQGQVDMDARMATPEMRQALVERFEAQVAEAPGLLLAAEGVSVMAPQELRALREWFESRGWKVRVLCQVRHLGSWVRSMVGQRVTGPMRSTIARAVEEFRADGSVVRKRLENLREAFPQVEFLSHEQALRHPGGPLAHFFAHAGLPALEGLAFTPVRSGASDAATRTISVLNEQFGRVLPDGRPHPKPYTNREVMRSLRHLGQGRFVLRPREVEPILPLLEAENQWLRDTLGEPFFDPSLAFPSARTEWDAAAVAQLRAAMKAMPPRVREWMRTNLERLGVRRGGNAAAKPH